VIHGFKYRDDAANVEVQTFEIMILLEVRQVLVCVVHHEGRGPDTSAYRQQELDFFVGAIDVRLVLHHDLGFRYCRDDVTQFL
jgi:hypothetical protein